MRALNYCRASRDRNLQLAVELRSVGDQDKDNRAFIARQGWTLVKTVIDANRSASDHARRSREGFAEVLASLAAGEVDVLVMWESSRGARQMADYSTLKTALVKAGALLAYGGKIYDLSRGDDAFSTGLDALLAEKEASVIRDRNVRTSRIRAEAGRPHGMLPYGYQRTRDARSGRMIQQVIDPVQAAVVLELKDRFLSGDTLNALARDFNDRGVEMPGKHRQKEGSPGWQAKSITQLLTSPAVAGLRQVQGEISGAGDWPGIITVEERDRILELLTDPRRRTHRGNTPTHLLTHIARCGSCGSVLVRSHATGLKGVVIPGLKCSRSDCPRKVFASESNMDDFVIEVVERWLSDEANIASLSRAETPVDTSALLAERVRLQALIDDAVAAYNRGELSVGVLASVEGGLQPLIDDLREQMRPRTDDPLVTALLEAPSPAAAWRDAELPLRRQLLKLLFDIRLDPAPRRGGRFSTSRVRVTSAH